MSHAGKSPTNHPIILVGGGKGGVGKSMLSMAVMDYLHATKKPTFLLETDTSAPDVWKTYGNEVDNQCVDLEQKEGWLEMLDLIERHAGYHMVINSKAANQGGLRRWGGMLMEALREQDRKLVVLWVIDRKRDGLELLASFMETLAPGGRVAIHAVRNLYWGDENKFEMYNGSEIRKEVERRGGKTLNFPDVADRVAEAINRDRMPIHLALTSLSFGSRIELSRWRGEYHQMITEILP